MDPEVRQPEGTVTVGDERAVGAAADPEEEGGGEGDLDADFFAAAPHHRRPSAEYRTNALSVWRRRVHY